LEKGQIGRQAELGQPGKQLLPLPLPSPLAVQKKKKSLIDV
jgi:hypothetical protein